MQRTISVVQSPLARNPAQPTTIKSAGQLEEDDEWVGSTKPNKQRERDQKDEMGKVVEAMPEGMEMVVGAVVPCDGGGSTTSNA
ncbi:hypothetical protein NL676_002154 [Syzygium grande]|nr:hypothetical protein NL676_002154 [Syzygium grande]